MSSKKHKKTKFQEHWLQDPILKLCTERISDDETQVGCIYCKRVILVENYLDHVASNFHNSKIPENHKTILAKFREDKENIDTTVMKSYLNAEFNKRQLELMILNFIIQNNVSFKLGERLAEFLSSLSPQRCSQINNIALSRRKIGIMVSNAIKNVIEDKSFEDLKTYKFSLLLDSVKDCAGVSHLGIMARYYKNGKIKQYLISNVEIKEAMTGENIYKVLETRILKDPDIAKNLIALSTDNAKNFSGSNVGLLGRLKNNYPSLFYQSCMCHNLDLVAEEAMDQLPKEILFFLRKSQLNSLTLQTRKKNSKKYKTNWVYSLKHQRDGQILVGYL